MKIFKCIVIAILTSKLFRNTWMHLITIINYNTYYALMFTIHVTFYKTEVSEVYV